MEVFDRIAEQIDIVGVPLFAVTMTALPCANTPVLLMLHWHGFRPDPDRPADASASVPRLPVPGSALQLNPAWHDLESLDDTMLDAAWRLGAWELDREQRRGCATAGASEVEAVECRQAFGVTPFGTTDEDFLLAEAPDRPQLLEMGTRLGYVHWKFRPVRGGVWRDVAEDDTLADDGGRTPPCPVAARTLAQPGGPRIRFRLGRVDRLIVR